MSARQRFSDVLSLATQSAISAFKDERAADFLGDVTAATWRAMYEAQCSATDEFAKRAAAKSDRALQARIAELEAQIAAVNENFHNLNFAQLVIVEQAKQLTARIADSANEVPQTIRKASDLLHRVIQVQEKA